MLPVVKFGPLPNNVPADAASYQSMVVPAGLVADIVVTPIPHRCALTGLAGADGIALIVATTAVLPDDMQPVVVFLVCA